jgi:hypothetical protein
MAKPWCLHALLHARENDLLPFMMIVIQHLTTPAFLEVASCTSDLNQLDAAITSSAQAEHLQQSFDLLIGSSPGFVSASWNTSPNLLLIWPLGCIVLAMAKVTFYELWVARSNAFGKLQLYFEEMFNWQNKHMIFHGASSSKGPCQHH